MANEGLLAVHAIANGPLTLRLPRPRRVRDAFDGRDLGTVDRVRTDVRRGDTFAWHLRG